MSNWTDALMRLDLYNSAVAWARTQPSPEVAWATCQRGDWMLRLLSRCQGVNRRMLVKAAALCARPPVAALADEHMGAICRKAVQTCIAWSEGTATDSELRMAAKAAAAWAAAWEAAVEAGEAWAAAEAWASRAGWATARAAEAGEDAVAVAGAAREAARAVAGAARAVGKATEAEEAEETSLARSADIVRGAFPEPPKVPHG